MIWSGIQGLGCALEGILTLLCEASLLLFLVQLHPQCVVAFEPSIKRHIVVPNDTERERYAKRDDDILFHSSTPPHVCRSSYYA